ncbi:dTDP-4-dehydrorhamnose reductase [soil metagenome]
MKVLITGANGFLGQHLSLFLAERDFQVIACSRGACRIPLTFPFNYFPIDLTDETAVNTLLDTAEPHIVIHTAANSKPDDCEINKDDCLMQNVSVTKFLLSAALNQPIPPHFIYLSTDFVFGEHGPHNEDDTATPLNFYGKSKLMAEQCVKESGLNHTIVRPVFIYGKVWPGLRNDFLHWVKNSLEQQKSIKVVSDQQRTPTFVNDLCKGIEAIITQNEQGVFHLAGKDLLSPFDMAMQVASILGLDAALIENVTSDSFVEPVIRARRSGLKIDKARKRLHYEPLDFAKAVELTFNNN